MFKKITILVLTTLVLNLFFGPVASAQSQTDKDAQRSRDAQIYVNRLGVGRESKVVVKFKDKRKSLKGYVSKINDDDFVVTDKKTGGNSTVSFSEVKKVEKDRINPFAIVGLTLAAIFGITAIVCVTRGCD